MLGCLILQLYFTKILVNHALIDWDDFKQERDSYISMFLAIINSYVQAIVWLDYFKGNPILARDLDKGIFAFTCFFLWVRLYIMMRIFTDYAHFITVIFEVIK